MIKYFFYFFASILIYSALRVVLEKNPVHAALHLVLAFFSSAAIWILLEAEFLGITLVLVYVGAVMVLFLFVVMMLDIKNDKLRENFVGFLPVGVGIALLLLVEIFMVLWGKFSQESLGMTHKAASIPNTVVIGNSLYNEYVYPFEIASVILLVAMIVAMILTLRKKRSKIKSCDEQILLKREERIRLVSMPAEQ